MHLRLVGFDRMKTQQQNNADSAGQKRKAEKSCAAYLVLARQAWVSPASLRN